MMNTYDVEAGRQWVSRAHVKNGIGRLGSYLCTFLPPEQHHQKKIMMNSRTDYLRRKCKERSLSLGKKKK